MRRHSSPVQIERDPFGRKSLLRELVHNVLGIRSVYCRECDRRARFYYWWSRDDRPQPISPAGSIAFCSIECFRAYYS